MEQTGEVWGIRSRERPRALAVWKAEELGHSSLDRRGVDFYSKQGCLILGVARWSCPWIC